MGEKRSVALFVRIVRQAARLPELEHALRVLDRPDDSRASPLAEEVDELLGRVERAMEAVVALRRLVRPELVRCWERVLDDCRRTRRAWERAEFAGRATEYVEADHHQARLALDGVVQATILSGGR